MNELDQFAFMDTPGAAVPPPAQLGADALEQFAFMDEGGDYTLGEYAQQAGSSFVGGLTGTFTGAVKGLGILSERLTGESELDDWATEMEASIQQAVPGVMGLQDSWTGKISGAFGSAAGFVAAGALTGGASAVVGRGLAGVGALGRAAGATAETVALAGQAAGRIGQMTSAGVLGALGNGASRYEEAKMLGKSEDEAWGSYLAGIPIGSLEALPIGLSRSAQRLGRFNKASGDAIRKLTVGQVMLAEGLEEAGQEMLNEGLNQLSDYAMQIKTAEEAFDFQQMLESGVLGFLPGSAIGGLTAKAQIAADMAEQRKAAAEKEAAELPDKLRKQAEEERTQQLEALTAQGAQLNELVAMGEARMAELAPPVAEGAEPPVVTPERQAQIDELTKNLDQIRKQRDIVAKQLEYVGAEADADKKYELAGAYGQARAASELAGLLPEFEAAQQPGAERILNPDEQAKWDAVRGSWKSNKAFAGMNVDAFKLVLPASEAQAKAEKILTDLGQRVEYIDLGEGSETVQGFIQGGAIYLNSRMSEADLLRTVARHEGYHSLFRNQPEEWEATLNKMQEVAPNVFAAAMRKAAMEIAAVRGEKPEKLTKFLQTEEGRRLLEDETLSSAADIFSATIDTLRENPALADELIQKDPGFFRRIYEWVKERLNAIGFKFETLSAKEQKALAKLPKLLYATEEGDVEVEASVNERIAGAQTLIALWDRAQAETTVALSSRQRQAKIFAQRTLGDIAARKSVEAKVKEGIDIEDAAAAAERKAAEEKRLAAIAKKRAAEVTRIKNKIKQISVDDEVWPQVEAVGKATTIDERNAAAQNFTASLPDATAEEIDQIAKAVSARYDQVAKKELAKKQKEDTAAQRLKDRQAEAAQRKKDAEAAQQRRDAEAKARQAERKAQRAKAAAEREAKQAQQKADREAEKARKAQERQRLAENRKNAAAAKLAERQAEKARKEAEKAQKQADKTAAKVAEQKRLEQEAAAAAEAAAQAEQEAAEARKRRKGERIPRVRRGAIAPGQLSVGDIVNYRNRMAKVIEATGSGLEQRVRLQRLTDSEAERAQTLERPDWWNEVVFAGQVVDVDMTSSDIVSLVASRSETEVLREEGKKMLAARIRAEMERREGDQPRFSVLGSYDDAAVDERYNFALGAVEAFKAGGETMSNAVWSAIHDYKSREYDRGEWDKAIAYYEENGIWSYLEAGQYTIPVQVDVDVEPVLEEDEDGPVFSINLGKKNQAKDRRTGLPRNKNGTVTVYYPTTSDSARKVIASRELVGHTPQATRIYVTNESNGSTVREAPGNIEQPLDGATVLLHIDPALLSVDETYDNGRRDFYISIREGESFKKRMKQIKLFGMSIDKADKIDPSLKLKDLMTRFEGAIEQYRKLKPEKQRARLREAKKALKAQHNVGTLLSENAKLAKTWEKQGLRTPEGKKLRSTGLGLSAAQQISDTIVSCPNAGSCWWLCLGDTSGGNEIYGGEGSNRTGPRLSQFLKTEALALNPENFAIALYAEIDKFAKEVTRSRRAPSVRLNVTSDFPPSLWKPLHDAFPRVMFYDYTKTSAKPISPNHHLTYSGTGWSQEIDGKYYNNRNSNWNLMRIRLSEGFNVALSFTAKKGEDLPETITDSATGKVYKVIDGDTYDARYLDKQPEGQQGVIVGLRNKDDTRAGGKDPLLADFATHSQSLFVYYDSEVHGKNLTVPKQKAAKGVKSSDIAFSVKVRKPTLVVSFVAPRGQAATEAWDAIAEYIENVAYDWDSFYTEENQPDFDAEYLKGYAEEIRDAQNRRGIIIGSNINLFVQERIDDIIDDRRIDNAESVAVLRRIQRRLKIEGYADVSPRMKAQTVLSEWMKLRRKGEGAEGKTSRKLLEYLVAMPEYEPQFGKSGAQLFPSDLEFQQQTVSKIRPLAREILAVNNKRLETIVDLKKGRAFSRLYGGIKLDPRITNESYPFVIIHEIAHQITQYTVNKDLHDGGHFDKSLIGNDYKEQIESNLKAIEFGAVQGSSASGVYRVGSAYLQAVNAYSQIWIENNPDAVAKAGSAEAAKSLYIKSVLGGHPDRALKSKSKGSFNYYMSNVDEFIAGAMSDIEFQKWLNSIPAEGEPGVSLWQKFIEAVSLILGISVDQRSLLAQVLSGVEEIAKTEQPSDIATGPMFSVRASVTPEMDAAYLAAVERGDLDTAQRMVDEAAKAAGYQYVGYHASQKEFFKFLSLAEQAEEEGIQFEYDGYEGGNLGLGFYFTPDLSYARTYGKPRKFYLKINNPVDARTKEVLARFDEIYNELVEDQGGAEQGEVFDVLVDELQADGVVAVDAGGFARGATEYLIKRSNQAKLADPVTRDKKGRVIPLSERFDEDTDDIRFSVLASKKDQVARVMARIDQLYEYGQTERAERYDARLEAYLETLDTDLYGFEEREELGTEDDIDTRDPYFTLAEIYGSWKANKLGDLTNAQLAGILRNPEGFVSVPTSVSDEQLIEAAKDAFESRQAYVQAAKVRMPDGRIVFSAKGKGKGGGKPKKPKRVSAKAAKAATQSARSAAARLRAAQAAATARARKELPAVKSLLETTIEEGEGTAVGEAPGTAIAAGGEESRAMIRVLRENLREVDAQVLPNLTMDDAARDEAASRLADDYEGVKAELFREIDETGNVSEPWKVYATMLISASEAEKATTGRMTVAKYMAAYEAENRDAIVRRAASANLRVRQDAVVSARRRNQAHVFAETRTLRRNIEKLRKAASEGNKKEREKAERKVAKLRREHAKAVVEAIEDLQQEGYDTEGTFSYLSGGDPVTFARIVRRINDAKVLSDIKGGYVSSVWDAIMEARMASLLSGPATHSANIAGNAAMLTLRTTRQLAEVLTNTVIRDRTSTDFGDFKAYMTGFLRSLGRAGRNLMMAYRTDMPVFEAIISRESALEIAEKTNGIPGLIGRMLRLPSLTTLRAFDEFFKTIAAHTEAASLAYRNGRARGLSGDALEAYIDRVLNDFTDPVWQEGLDAALKTVFQDKADKLTQILLSTRSFLDNNPTTVPVGSYLLPFVKTPLQIFKVGLAMPIHPIIPIFRWVNRKRMGEEYTGKEKVTDSANALVSMALFVAAYTMLGDDDDEESRVTGAAPDIWEERLLSQRTAPAYSIKSSDGEWYTYARIEPFATGFSAMVDGIRAQQRLMRDDVPDKWSQGMSIMFNNVLGQIEDKTFLRTVGDVAKMFRERDQINAAKFARDLFVTPMIPNLMRQTVGNTDPYIRNTTVREYEDKSTWESATQSLSYIAWPDSDRPDAPPMRYDLWGRPIKRSGDSAFARNFSPAQKVYEEDDVHKLDRLIVTFNDKVADGKFGGAVEKYLPRSPEYRINRGKETYILGDEEYARYSKEAGELAAKRLSRARLNYDDPTERDIDRVRDEIARSRKLVVDRILRERRRLPQPQEQEQ